MNNISDSDRSPTTGTTPANSTEGTTTVPRKGRLLGLDYGARRIGVAVCDDMQIIASPVETYTRSGDEADASFLRELVGDYRIVGIVVGLPVHMSGDEGGKAAEARAFGEWVAQLTSRPVAFWDERFTSATADDYLRAAGISRRRRKERKDKVAAQLILQGFIDSNNRLQPPSSLRS